MNLKIKLYDLKCALTRAYTKDAGLDCYARIPNRISISQHTTVKIPLGFSVEIPEYHVGDLRPRSGHSAKGITVGYGTIDCGYTGEIYAVVTNTTDAPYIIEPYEKIAQLVIVPIGHIDEIEFVTELEQTDRGTNGFGSSGL